MLKNVDKTLLFTVLSILVVGLVIFSSASLGVLSVNENKFYSVIKNQLVFAILGGGFALFLGLYIPISFYKKYAFQMFFLALFLTILVFVPGLSQYHGGAHRWIDLGFISIQPSEFLKFTFVLAVALFSYKYRNMFGDIRYGLLPYLGASFVVTVIMLSQPDFGTYLIIMTASFFTFFIGGGRQKHIYMLIGLGISMFLLLLLFRPYMVDRIKTFFDHSQDVRGSSWQLNQSLIAFGSGGLFGRGLGQSVQKFNYLPEPIGDSIFAVAGEEFGLIGATFIIILYVILVIRGYMIAKFSNDQFSRLIAMGIVAIIISQAFLNMSSMIGILPLTGVPLPLISHGGTALVVALFQMGVLLNISKGSKIKIL